MIFLLNWFPVCLSADGSCVVGHRVAVACTGTAHEPFSMTRMLRRQCIQRKTGIVDRLSLHIGLVLVNRAFSV